MLHQGLHAEAASPVDIVSKLGCMQAQDPVMAQWAVGIRMQTPSLTQVAAALDSGKVLRTHILRPTWHYVTAEDLRWMMRITAPTIQTAMRAMDVYLGITPQFVKKAYRQIEASLRNNTYLTREELTTALAAIGLDTSSDSRRMIHLYLRAETDLLICSGPMKGKKLTYALVDERVPHDQQFKKEEALYELALRYFSSHGPASLDDFRWWSGLNVKDARTAVDAIRSHFTILLHNKKELFYQSTYSSQTLKQVRLLPAFDEFLVSYRDRSAALDDNNKRKVITVNGIFRPVITVKGSVMGTWKIQPIARDRQIEIDLFYPPKPIHHKLIPAEIQKVNTFFKDKE